jgi:hypothetical protein
MKFQILLPVLFAGVVLALGSQDPPTRGNIWDVGDRKDNARATVRQASNDTRAEKPVVRPAKR